MIWLIIIYILREVVDASNLLYFHYNKIHLRVDTIIITGTRQRSNNIHFKQEMFNYLGINIIVLFYFFTGIEVLHKKDYG